MFIFVKYDKLMGFFKLFFQFFKSNNFLKGA